MILLNFTPEVDLLTRGEDPEWSAETQAMLEAHPVDVVHEEIAGLEKREDGWLEAFEFENTVGPRPTSSRTESGDGTRREYRGGFPMYGADYNTDLAESLGVTSPTAYTPSTFVRPWSSTAMVPSSFNSTPSDSARSVL